MFKRATWLAAVLLSIAAVGCSGSDGAQGPQGPQGPQGTQGPTGPAGQDLTATAKPESCAACHSTQGDQHQAIYTAGKTVNLLASVDAVEFASSVATVHFTVTDASGNGLNAAAFAALGTKRFYGVTYDPASRSFDGSAGVAPTFSGRYIADPGFPGVDGKFVTTASVAVANPNMVVAMLAGTALNYEGTLMDKWADAVWTDGTVDYQSNATGAACARCHGQPFLKGGYRPADKAFVAFTGTTGADFLVCKACHYDTRAGHDADWQRMVDDPVGYATTLATPAQLTAYAYKAKVMNDVHMAHAMEFAYPMSMSNCATCHTTAAQLTAVLADANYQIATCRSCHPISGPANAADAEGGRAPALITLMTDPSLTYNHASLVAVDPNTGMSKLYAAGPTACTGCHDGSVGPTFATVHNGGYNVLTAKADGTRYDATTKLQVDSASYDATSHVATVHFSAVGAPTNALIKPTVVASLYGYDTKDFVVSGHSSQFADRSANLEWSEGGLVHGTNISSNSSRLVVTPSTATQGNTTWTAAIDLTTWAPMIAAGQVKQIEVGVLPTMALDPTQAVSTTNPAVAVAGATQTIDVTKTAADATTVAYGKNIVSAQKCDSCHDALGTTFHAPSNGSAGVVGCRLCHFAGAGSFHLEMQSRSIDSFVHAIHEFQNLDTRSVDFTNPLQAWRYDDHINASFPATLTDCQACHNSGTFNPPRNDLSLPGIQSAVDTKNGAPLAVRGGWQKASSSSMPTFNQVASTIGNVPSYVTGPAARACGGCHRAYPIKSNDAAGLMTYIDHTGTMGYALPATTTDGGTTTFMQAISDVMKFFQ